MRQPVLVTVAVQRALALRNVSFLQAVGVLITGTALSQLLSLAITPVLTRIYTPDDFDVLSIFAGTTIISSLGACLGFDFSIPLAKDDKDATNLLVCALLGVVASTAIVALGVLLFLTTGPVTAARASQLSILLYLVPASTLLVGASNAFEYWATRHRRFSTISTSRIVQVVIGGGVQVVGGAMGRGTGALLVGYALLNGLAIVTLSGSFLRHDRRWLSHVRGSEVRRVAREYSAFLRYTGLEAVANACSVYVPLIIISTMLAGPQAGYLLLAVRLVQAPLQLVGRSVSQVNQSRLSLSLQEGRLADETARLFRTLVAVVVPPFVGATILAPTLAGVVLGARWRQVGVYVCLIMPWVLLHFASAAILPTMYALRRNAQVMILTMGGLAFRVAAVATAVRWFAAWAPAIYAGSGAIFYGVSAFVFLRANGVGARRVVQGSAPFWMLTVSALVLAEAVKWLFCLVLATSP